MGSQTSWLNYYLQIELTDNSLGIAAYLDLFFVSQGIKVHNCPECIVPFAGAFNCLFSDYEALVSCSFSSLVTHRCNWAPKSYAVVSALWVDVQSPLLKRIVKSFVHIPNPPCSLRCSDQTPHSLWFYANQNPHTSSLFPNTKRQGSQTWMNTNSSWQLKYIFVFCKCSSHQQKFWFIWEFEMLCYVRGRRRWGVQCG